MELGLLEGLISRLGLYMMGGTLFRVKGLIELWSLSFVAIVEYYIYLWLV